MQDKAIEIRQKTESLKQRIESRYNAAIIQLEDMERNWELLTRLSDTNLRLYQKNSYFRYHGRNAVWPLTNFSDCPELKTDPVFQELQYFHEEIHRVDSCAGALGSSLNKVLLEVDTLATKMANRSMKKEEYEAILLGKHEIFQGVPDAIHKLLEKRRKRATIKLPA